MLIASFAFSSTVSALSVNVGVNASVAVHASSTARSAKVASRVISKGDQDIENRIDALNKLSTRVNDMKFVSAPEKASISANIQTQIVNLTSLKAKIDADADSTTTLTADFKSITVAYRIYLLVLPQTQIIAAADRVNVIASDMNTLGAKFQSRITVAQTAGKDVSGVQALLSDFSAKVADAQAQATAATNGVSGLTPDQGDATKAAANLAALKNARQDIRIATTDLQIARQDANKIAMDLKQFHIAVTVTASSTATTTAQ